MVFGGGVVKRSLLLVLAVAAAQAQKPQITPGGVVSAASYGSPIAPGELIAVFGANFVPWNTSVTVNGVAAQVVAVAPAQVNAIVPTGLPTQDPNLLAAAVVVTTPVGSSSAEIAALAGSAPALFTADGSGCGQAAALNIRPDGSTSVNSASNSAAPGDFIALFGTGFSAAATRLFLDNSQLPAVAYSGPAPGLAGVEQVNFQIPASSRNGCGVPVWANQSFWSSPTATVAVQSGRGKCVDPPVQSYGTISLSSFFSAQFPSGPNVTPPVAETIVFAPQWAMTQAPALVQGLISAVPFSPRNCTVPGYTYLSAGPIQIQPPSGSPVVVAPQVSAAGSLYGVALPAGLVPGTYTISGSFGSPVPLNTTVTVGSPIQVTPPPATVSQSQALTVKWTGGDSTSLVRVALVSGGMAAYSYAYATAGSLTFSPTGLPVSANAQITVEVLPVSPKSLLLPGITGPVSVTWEYNYSFAAGLSN
jgi:uncharacterized protein (TIGR03437 family)